jgi:hypothetical protein
MLRFLIAIALLGLSTASAQTLATKPGDTVWVVVHHVRAGHRAAYDSLMQNVWWPVAQAAGERHPSYGKLLAARRRYVPTEMGSDSTYTFVYVYFGRPDLPKSAHGGNYVFAAAGRSKAESEAFGHALRSYLAGSSSGPLVDEAYR